jgi:hypothetical protein
MNVTCPTMSTDATDDPPANVLFEWYERYVGQQGEGTEVYLGFGLFFSGIALGVLGVVLFLWSATVTSQSFHYTLREIAAAAGAFGLPALLLGVAVLLPVRRRTVAAALLGTGVCAAAVVWFAAAYPRSWNVDAARDVSAEVVSVYMVGLVAVIGATGAALVGHRVERAGEAAGGAAAGEAAAGGGDAGTDAGDGVSDEDVRRDIDEAMADAELSWGGVRRTETKRLTIDTGDDGDDVERSGLDPSSATETREGGGVDDAVSGLRQLQGREEQTDSGSGTDDQTAALRELRERQRESERRAEERDPVNRLQEWVREKF